MWDGNNVGRPAKSAYMKCFSFNHIGAFTGRPTLFRPTLGRRGAEISLFAFVPQAAAGFCCFQITFLAEGQGFAFSDQLPFFWVF
jgi:hypothetical protein